MTRSKLEFKNGVTVAEAIAEVAERLAAAKIKTARLDAEVLLRHILGIDRTGLFLRLPEPLGAVSRADFRALVERRMAGEPVAYLTGTREFMGLPFAVGPGVLIPRPETELLVEWALTWLTGRPAARVVDAGTGSGAIALALAYHLPPSRRATIVGAEISHDALSYAVQNRKRLGLCERVHLVRGNLITWCRGPVDLLLANLPYLRPDQIGENPDLHVEPEMALSGGEDGLDLIRALVADAPRVLAAGGALGLEIDPSHADTVRALVTEACPKAMVNVLPDLAGLPRHIVANLSAPLS